ncbi:MAG TPA: hypothetical protein PLI95_07775 [Polyangiaceae bacterium]|nr:hypothetical protein [Polyangiaceae bacterium]
MDLEKLPADLRQRLITIGRQFGSADTIAQGEATVAACDRHGPALEAHGFVSADLARLREAIDALRATGAADEPPASARKSTSREYVETVRVGKTLRQQARSILFIVMQRLAASPDSVEHEAARSVSSSLDKTQSSRGDPILLGAQLDQLRATLTMARVDRAAALRGADALVPQLARVAERLRAIPVDTSASPQADAVDLLDGIIVELVRDARRAARSAARTLGRPEVAAAFELVCLSGGVPKGR